jgi:hypothetical protein
MERWIYSSTILDLGTDRIGQLHTPATKLPGKVSRSTIWWAPQPVWTLSRRGISHDLAGKQTLTVQPVGKQ